MISAILKENNSKISMHIHSDAYKIYMYLFKHNIFSSKYFNKRNLH